MNLLAMSSVFGFLGVALGAFGAHGLQGRLTAEGLGWWETATFYLLVHAVAGLSIGLQDRVGHSAGWLMILGAGLFASTLFAMALGAPRMLGAITPVGGLLMLGGWATLALAAVRLSKL
ncbi:MAG: DUF423 domain-containing protein [Pseudomonadota bacterium]